MPMNWEAIHSHTSILNIHSCQSLISSIHFSPTPTLSPSKKCWKTRNMCVHDFFWQNAHALSQCCKNMKGMIFLYFPESLWPTLICLQVIVGFELTPATALSHTIVSISAIASSIYGLCARNPNAPDRSLIDWDLAIFIPALLVGVSVGESKEFPDHLILRRKLNKITIPLYRSSAKRLCLEILKRLELGQEVQNKVESYTFGRVCIYIDAVTKLAIPYFLTKTQSCDCVDAWGLIGLSQNIQSCRTSN